MRTVTLGISSIEQTKRRLAGALRGLRQGSYISFETVEVLWKVLTAKRWQILKVMTGQGRLSIREVARRVDRDVKSVHADVTALVRAGVLDQSPDGVEFPYDAVRVDFTLGKAA
jgi:predicted transcriptional regulator